MARGEGSVGDVFDATTARRRFSEIFDRAVRAGVPVPVERGGKERGFFIGEDDLKRLTNQYEFHPEVLIEDDTVSVWLPEFAIYGVGSTYEEAKEDLLDEVLDYVEEYLETPEMRWAVNRHDHYPYALRVLISEADDSLEALLFAEPSTIPEPAAV